MQSLKLLLIVLISLTSACTAVPPVTNEIFNLRNDALFKEKPNIPSIAEVHKLTPAQQDHFLAYLNRSSRAHIPAHELIANYMEGVTENFTYQESTFSAAETFESRRGDCMSLAVLTTALAQIAGVQIEYELVDSDPVFELAPNLAVRGIHVRSHLIDPEWQAPSGQLVFIKPGLVIDYFPSGKERFIENLDKGEYASRFYLNLATEHLQRGDLDKSYWLTIAALEHDAESADALNALAVIYRRKGSAYDAERIYQYAIGKVPNKLSLLRNYELLLSSLGRTQEADHMQVQLRNLDDPSPFSWYRGARQAAKRGEWQDAQFFYKKAIERAPYMPELRYGLAQVLSNQGDYHLAEAEIQKSLENVWSKENRKPYKAKLNWLQTKTESTIKP